MARPRTGDSNLYRQRERRLLSEWLIMRYPGLPVKQNIRLGTITPRIGTEGLSQSELAFLGFVRRYADALVIAPTNLVLIEASIPPRPGYISQLQLYRRLLPLTPELEEYRARSVEMVYLCAIEDPVVTMMAHEAGIRVEIYRPPWVDEYLGTLQPSERQGSVTGGLEKI